MKKFLTIAFVFLSTVRTFSLTLACLLLFTLQQAFSQTLTLDPPGPYIDACEDLTTTVTANPSGALSYDWYRDDCAPVWLAISGQTVDLSTGHWYCVATWPGNSTSTSSTIAVRIPISVWCEILNCGASYSCASAGCSLELSGPLCPNEWDNYQWTLNNIPISGATNSIYNATASGVYHCIFGNTLCSVTSYFSAIIQFPCDVPTNRTTTNVTFNKAKLNWQTNDCALHYKVKYRPVGGLTYTKKNTNGNVSYKNISGLTPNTQYQWRVRSKCENNPNAWSDWSGAAFFTTTLRLGEFDEETKLTIYPNPAAAILSVGIESNDQLSHILIQNSLGQMVLEKNLEGEETSATELDVSALPAGVYLLMVFTSKGKTTKIFVKQ